MKALTALALFGLLQDGSPQKGATIEHLFARHGEFNIWGDVVVATVKSVSEGPHTNGNPPKVELEIQELLCGDPKTPRARALWKPFPHDVDWVGAGAEERLAKWDAQPMTPPKVGDKWLLSGTMESGGKIFEVWSTGRVLFTPEGRTRAVAEIKRMAEIDRKTREENARALKERQEALARWRAKVSAKDIANYVAAADFVGIGRIGGGPSAKAIMTFEITEILKGVPRQKLEGGRYYLKTDLPGELMAHLGNREYPCILFLSEKGLDVRAGAAPLYPRIALGDGVVIADEESLRAARDASKK